MRLKGEPKHIALTQPSNNFKLLFFHIFLHLNCRPGYQIVPLDILHLFTYQKTAKTSLNRSNPEKKMYLF